MGWANCGEDSKGGPIGYAHPATCDHDGCDAKIDRGLAYACGGMHGEFDSACEGYFCEKHLHRYLAEFDFRYNNRVRLGVDDEERTIRAVSGVSGKRLMYADSSVR